LLIRSFQYAAYFRDTTPRWLGTLFPASSVDPNL
jgi:hypothetical protein